VWERKGAARPTARAAADWRQRGRKITEAQAILRLLIRHLGRVDARGKNSGVFALNPRLSMAETLAAEKRVNRKVLQLGNSAAEMKRLAMG